MSDVIYKNNEIRNTYNIYQVFCLVLTVIRTRLICRKARIIRTPIIIRGKKYIDFGEQLTTGVGCRFEAYSQDQSPTIIFGHDVQIMKDAFYKRYDIAAGGQ